MFQRVEPAELGRAEELYRLISENSQDIISYATFDGIWIYVSPSVTSLLGYQPEELIGKSSFSFFHPDDVPDLAEAQGKIRDHDFVDCFVCRVRHRDGTYIWYETTIRAVRDDRRNVLGLITIGRDISKRKFAEEEPLRSMRELERAQSFAQLGSWTWRPDEGRLEWSRQVYDIVGLPPDTPLTLHKVLPFVHAEDRDRVYRSFELSAIASSTPSIEFRFVRPDGDVRTVRSQAEVMSDSGGGRYLYGVLQDITVQKQAELALRESEERLRQSEKLSLVGQLAAGVAHEIRNPLTALKGFTQLLHAKAASEERAYFDLMLSELNRIESTLSEMLLLAKPQAVSYEAAPIDVVLQETAALLEPQALLHNVVIWVECAGDVPTVHCVRNQLKQVFVNVMKNAIEAMPDGGSLVVTLKRDGQWLSITFQDNGIGISEERLTHLGEPFYTTKEAGTGLGLTVSYRIIESHGGRLQVASTVGAGTTVQIDLPC